MKILAFDIGIKNLSYCLLSDDNDTLNIIDWDLINLSQNEDFYCESLLKNKKQCEKVAKYYIDDCYYCKRHKIPKSKVIKKEKRSLSDHAIEIKRQFDMREEMQDIDVVLIENQPVFMNPVMKSIQIIVFSYFCFKITENHIIVNNVNARTKENLPNNDTKWVSTKYYDNFAKEIGDKKDKYKRRKIICREYAKYLLDNQPGIQDFLLNHKKQDDLTDCFLMCVYFLKKNK